MTKHNIPLPVETSAEVVFFPDSRLSGCFLSLSNVFFRHSLFSLCRPRKTDRSSGLFSLRAKSCVQISLSFTQESVGSLTLSVPRPIPTLNANPIEMKRIFFLFFTCCRCTGTLAQQRRGGKKRLYPTARWQLSACLRADVAPPLLSVLHLPPPQFKMGSLWRMASLFLLCRRLQRCHASRVLWLMKGLVFYEETASGRESMCVLGCECVCVCVWQGGGFRYVCRQRYHM